ncbi:unnamed protein product [Cutaneotrichosporon oleaginosum]
MGFGVHSELPVIWALAIQAGPASARYEDDTTAERAKGGFATWDAEFLSRDAELQREPERTSPCSGQSSIASIRHVACEAHVPSLCLPLMVQSSNTVPVDDLLRRTISAKPYLRKRICENTSAKTYPGILRDSEQNRRAAYHVPRPSDLSSAPQFSS